jgi:probable F420-dependent oxidoreductase
MVMKLGVCLPLVDIGGEPSVVREFAQTAEGLGYSEIGAPDHVLGVNVATRPDWGARNTSKDYFHDPFVLFGFLAGVCQKAVFSTQVLILPQRQTVLAAKQAASLDVLSGGRFRFGIGVGWNPVEFVGLNENFHNRGRRSEEQVEVMQALWAGDHVKFKGKYHEIDDAGIRPRPASGRIPLWYGGHEDVTLKRIAKYGDGWMMLSHPVGEQSRIAFGALRRHCDAAGRDWSTIGLEVWTSCGVGGPAEWRTEALAWKALGVTHLTLNNTFGRYHHTRIEGRTMAAHLAALRAYRDAVAEVL